MITFNRTVFINWKLNPTAFEIINTKAYRKDVMSLSSAVKPSNNMASRDLEMRLLLAEELGASPDATSNNWQALVQNYWDDFYLEVPRTGFKLDTSLIFDINDFKRKDYIAKYIKDNIKEKSDSEDFEKIVANHIKEHVLEEEITRYLIPVNIKQYLAWRYALISSRVANNASLMNKSSKIDFYLTDEDSIRKSRMAENEKRVKAISLYTKLVSKSSASSLINILIGLKKVLTLSDIKKLKDVETDIQPLLLEVATSNPDKFIKISEDKSLTKRSQVRKFQMAGLIRKLPNSTVIVDSSDPSIVLGNTENEAISFLANSVNSAYLNELTLKFKSLIK